MATPTNAIAPWGCVSGPFQILGSTSAVGYCLILPLSLFFPFSSSHFPSSHSRFFRNFSSSISNERAGGRADPFDTLLFWSYMDLRFRQTIPAQMCLHEPSARLSGATTARYRQNLGPLSNVNWPLQLRLAG